jgi:hypothetical protein
MSACFDQVHRAVLSYDESDLPACVSRMAQTARRNQQTLECVISDLKFAVNSLPIRSLRDRARRELCDVIVRVAVRAYYDSSDSATTQLAWR